ncbi:unnamed protein product [Ixodes persulcatus]
MSSVIMELQTSFYGRRIRPKDFGAEWVSTSTQIRGIQPFPEPASKILLNSRNLPSCRVVLSRWTPPKLQDAEASSGAKKPAESPTKGIKRKFTVLTENDEPQNDDKEMSYRAKIQKNIAEKMAFLESLGIDKFELRSPPKRAATRKSASTKPLPTERRKSQRLQSKDPDGQVLPKKVPDSVKKKKLLSMFFFFFLASVGSFFIFLTPFARRFVRPSCPCIRDLAASGIQDRKVPSFRARGGEGVKILTSKLGCVHCASKYGSYHIFHRSGRSSLPKFPCPHVHANMIARQRHQPRRLHSIVLRLLTFDENLARQEPVKRWQVFFFGIAEQRLQHCTLVGYLNVSLETLKVNIHHLPKAYRGLQQPCIKFRKAKGNAPASPQVTDDRNGKIATRGAIVPERVDSESDSHISCLNVGILKPAILTGHPGRRRSLEFNIFLHSFSQLTNRHCTKLSFVHNNMTGRWLTPFKAVWMPRCEDLFLVGSMEYPRRVEVFSSAGTLLHTLKGDSLTSICSLVDVHPDRFVVAGGNSSGRVHVFVEA